MEYNILYLYINTEEKELCNFYSERIKDHNKNITENPNPDSGFDLGVPEEIILYDKMNNSHMIDFKIKCKMVNKKNNSCGFYLYPRSSISKTPLMLSNQVGIIDSGYRGFIKGAFRNLRGGDYLINKFTRLLQICGSSLEPFKVVLIDSEDELGDTIRGEGGFGSTDNQLI